jgi:peptide-methionine (R)-S-oxide reductase
MKVFVILTLALAAMGALAKDAFSPLVKAKPNQSFACKKSDDQWRKILPHNTYVVMRQAGTERAFTGKYWDNHAKGTYACASCGLVLFSSEAKYDSGTGWPSFFKEIAHGRTLVRSDADGSGRMETICSRCGGHLGHAFDDGPEPTHLRYCMNSAALKFIKSK